MRLVFMIAFGVSFGLLAAAGVFTVLAAVGLVPRFAGRTHTAKKVFLFENMVVGGTIFGGMVSLFPQWFQFGEFWQVRFHQALLPGYFAGIFGQIVYGLFAGMFVGCLALAIAEMLDSIPIFTRRISFRHGLSLAVTGIALGKLVGALCYFYTELHRVVK